jgi:hypothetical protein
LRAGDKPVELQALFKIDKTPILKKETINEEGISNLDDEMMSANSIDPSQLFIVALSGLVNDEILSRGKECGFDEMSKHTQSFINFIFIVEAPITEAKIKEKIMPKILERY